MWYNNFMRLYHGSQNEVVMPRYGLGQDQHDFGRGFYLTDTEELAKEWAVYKPKSADRRRAPLFIKKYCVKEADDYDVVIGWRANGILMIVCICRRSRRRKAHCSRACRTWPRRSMGWRSFATT